MEDVSDGHPLDDILIKLETNYSATQAGLEETNRQIAAYLGQPYCDFTRSPEVVRRLIPPGWVYLFADRADGYSCFMRKGEQLTRGCGTTRIEALLYATLWAIRLEDNPRKTR
jgi:hypothetical protein